MSGMSRADRAKQFMPFAALKGFEEAIEKAAKRSQYMENYKKRKANGSQARYEKHTKGRRKAAIDAKKAALRAEDVANGLYTPVQPILEPQKGTIAI